MQSTQDYIPLAEASKLIPGHPHVSTLHRWCVRGVGGIKLEHQTVGVRRFVTPDAVQRFLVALNQTDDDILASEGC